MSLRIDRPWLIRTVGAAAAGIAMWGAFPPRNLWFLAVLALGVLALVLGVGRPRVRTGAWLGFVFGLGFFIPLLPWIGVYVGPLPWLALSAVLAGYLAVFGAIACLTMRLPVPPVWFAVSWVLIEAARSAFPFGGFPWGRTAFSQVDGPLLPIASILGAPGLSGAVALFGASIAWLGQIVVRALADRDHHNPGVARASAIAVVLALLGPITGIALTPDSVDRTVSGSSVRVAAVQGNVPRLGLDFNAQRRAVLDNHVRETQILARRIADGSVEQPDFVAWPENASDISPLTNEDAAREITEASIAVGAPILVGTLVQNADGRPTNTVLTWDGDRGPVGRYDKHIIQPFGEYLPWRSFFRLFSSYADMAGNFRPGSGPTSLSVPGRSGRVEVGVSTCWEVAFDRSARQSVREGAEILYVPTNNATFGRTEMTYQQLAMSQVRAVEHGRAVVVAATSGVSALVEPDGMIAVQSGFFTPDVLSARLPLHREQTLATRLGDWPQTLAMLLAAVGFLVALARHTRFSREQRERRSSEAVVSPTSGNEQPSGEKPDGAASDDATVVGPRGERALVVIPTFNERENLPVIVERLQQALPGIHVLIVDDSSPDGTGDVADGLASDDARGRIHVLHRTDKDGLGKAYLAGFAWGLARDYSVIIEMDADGSHAPEQLHRLLDAVNAGADLAIGSRYVPGGELVNWPKRREVLSRGANTYARIALGAKVHDITAGFRAYRRSVLEKIDLPSVESAGYCFQIDLAWRAVRAGFDVREVPITFTEREIGESKMSGGVMTEAFLMVARWGMQSRLEKLGLRRPTR